MRKGSTPLAGLLCAAICAVVASGAATSTGFEDVRPGQSLAFPRDHGSHPGFRTEWWYVTGWLETEDGKPLGFQVTFFRSAQDIDPANPSAFAARQVMIAHAMLADPERGELQTAQRIGREALGLAGAATHDLHAWLGDWSMQREGSIVNVNIPAPDFTLALELTPQRPPVLNGEAGYSRKGPAEHSASWYYSIPQLKVGGTVRHQGIERTVNGLAWLDHEWSTAYLEPGADGWDWVGLNFDDGGSLMAFRIRDAHGEALWAGATLTDGRGNVRSLAPGEVTFQPRREWTSARTGYRWPVAWTVRAGEHELQVEPLMDDQENDMRLTTGAVYWEGAVRVRGRGPGGREVSGKGFLELTGYGEPLSLR